MTPDEDLCWRVEEACLNAWPSPRHLLVDGYLLRSGGGPWRRTNSVNPMRGAGAPEPAVAACEAAYAALGRPAIFRIPGIAPQMDPVLARLGYGVRGETCTLFRDLPAGPDGPEPGVSVAEAPAADWLALRDAMNGHDPETARAFRAAAAAIALPTAFAAARTESGIGAIAFAVLDRALLVIESVATPENLRGRGHARRAVMALLHWGRSRGATAACLQVQADNAPARALYTRLGFARELYRYHYRIRLARA
ncbi:GNAT family N-acetyltransferase [Methylobacterium sp. NEAU 140]|uniref:GNAT family N-acetyltransferase n=1 Tax=Methylobacterium sp. NEAU 140 TaxID=3064945 RepID=UPI0027367101|nr:GNAT family N-acetyltransferase [Methylobacterium sp. NEAU 140]MDP4025905.1 GNAT family N-acetyltransferase [Methylobacterium sp. NEAU 140]